MTKQFYHLMKDSYDELEQPITADMLEDCDDEPDEDLESKINEADSAAGEDAEPYHAVICDENGIIYAEVINRGVDTIRTEFEIDIDEWWDTYTPIAVRGGENDGALLELKFHHRKLIRWLDDRRLLWTELDNGVIVAGYAYVNRMRYLVTREPYPEYGMYVVRIPQPESDDLLVMLESQNKTIENINDLVIQLIAERDALKAFVEEIAAYKYDLDEGEYDEEFESKYVDDETLADMAMTWVDKAELIIGGKPVPSETESLYRRITELTRELADINAKNIHVPMNDAAIRSVFGLPDDADVSSIDNGIRVHIQSNMEQAFYDFGDWQTIADNAASAYRDLAFPPVCMECQHWPCTCPPGFGCNKL